MAKFGGKQPGAGRPKGSTTKPRITDYLTEDEISEIIKKAKELALMGNEAMIKLIFEQHLGKPAQSMELTGKDGKDLIPDSEAKQKIDESIGSYISKENIG